MSSNFEIKLQPLRGRVAAAAGKSGEDHESEAI